MAIYRVTLTADEVPGAAVEQTASRRRTSRRKYRVIWEDPFKPSYLFALVAGDLHCHQGDFKTMTGRNIDLEIYVEHRDADKCEHALASLQRSMKWDEEEWPRVRPRPLHDGRQRLQHGGHGEQAQRLQLQCLNRVDTATDDDFEAVEAVIAHEYFHNWTGNRVTCRTSSRSRS